MHTSLRYLPGLQSCILFAQVICLSPPHQSQHFIMEEQFSAQRIKNIYLHCDYGPVQMVCSDDSWLDLTPEALDEMLQTAAGQRGTAGSEELDLKKVADSMNAFVNKVSGIDGVEFPRYILTAVFSCLCENMKQGVVICIIKNDAKYMSTSASPQCGLLYLSDGYSHQLIASEFTPLIAFFLYQFWRILPFFLSFF